MNVTRISAFAALLLAVGCTHAAPTSTTANNSVNSGMDAYGWCHAPAIRSTDATNFAFDYQLALETQNNNPLRVVKAKNPWFSVSKYGFQGNETVTVKLMVSRVGSGELFSHLTVHPVLEDTQTLALHWDANGQKFTGQPSNPPMLGRYYEGDSKTTMSIYEYEIEVNGQKLTDPVSGQQKFSFIPAKDVSGECQGQSFYNYN